MTDQWTIITITLVKTGVQQLPYFQGSLGKQSLQGKLLDNNKHNSRQTGGQLPKFQCRLVVNNTGRSRPEYYTITNITLGQTGEQQFQSLQGILVDNNYCNKIIYLFLGHKITWSIGFQQSFTFFLGFLGLYSLL